MSPDEKQEWRIEQLERRLERGEELARLESHEVAITTRRVDEHGDRFLKNEKDHEELWKEIGALRRMFVGFLVSVAVGAVLAAVAIAIQAGGGLP